MENSQSTRKRRGGRREAALRTLGLLCVAVAVALVGSAGVGRATPAGFTITDLGTLGGNESLAYAVNDSGQVVGYSTTAAGEWQRHAFAWTQAGGMVDLGTLGGPYDGSVALAVNESGQVVGESALTVGGWGYWHAFSWTQAGGMVDLGTLGGAFSRALAVNDSGQVVGDSQPAVGEPDHAFSWTQAGGMVDLGTLGGASSTVSWSYGVNDGGQVVGRSMTAAGELHAFSWTRAGGMVDLGTLGGGYSDAVAVNDGGQVVGVSSTAAGEQHAFSWTQAGGIVDLGTLGGLYSGAVAVNDSGQVVGYSHTAANEQHAFLWTQAGGMVDLGTFDGVGWSRAVAVTDSGQVVGYSFTAAGQRHAFSWTQAGGMVDLGTLGGGLSGAVTVNDSGQVVGYSATAGGTEHAVLWQPAAGVAPTITSPASVGFAVSSAGTFTITSTGEPSPALTLGGALPAGLAFQDNGDGTASLSGIPALGSGGVYQLTVTASNGVAPDAVQSVTLTVSYVFQGFFQPIDNGGVFNIVKAGRAIPVKFELNADQGLAIFGDGYPRSVTIDCDTAAAENTVEETQTAGNSSLGYDATMDPPIGQYTYVWKTDDAWAGSCRQLQLEFEDGQSHTANFRFTR